MNNAPKVSVIIPVYNVEKFLEECLDSAIGQTLKDIEIICIDDGSTDSSPGILQSYAQRDPRIIVITQENQGLGAARNRGLDIAKGKYIAFIDSDDFIVENTLAELFAFAESKQVDMVGFNAFPAFESQEMYTPGREALYDRKQTIEQPVSGLAALDVFLKHSEYRIPSWYYFYRSDFLKENHLRFYKGIIHEDDLFTFQCLLYAKRFIQVPGKYYCRRFRKNSIMTRPESKENLRGHFLAMVGMLRLLNGIDGIDGTGEENIKRCVDAEWYQVQRLLKKLPRDEVLKLAECSELNERVLFHLLLKAFPPDSKNNQNDNSHYQELQKIRKDNEMYRQELQGVQQENELYCQELQGVYASKSFRIGHFITYIPRKIRGGIRCCQEHGVGYTLRRIKEKIAGLIGVKQ